MSDAGRALDERIEREVLGIVWDESRCRVCGWKLDNPPIRSIGCAPDDCSMRPLPRQRADEPAPYSTKIDAAWLLVEALRARGWRIVIEVDAHGGFQVMLDTRRFFHVEEDADSMPLALCRAALAVVA